MLCVDHGRTSETGNSGVVFINEMEVTDSGELVVHGPTTGKD